jgi:uncharacterized protein (DUF1015 family)
MADIRAFRAFRYDLGRVGALSDVVAPPYDVIEPTLQKELYDRSPYNVVRLILNLEQSTDSETNNRYTRAARTLKDWIQDGVLAQDSARALYVYHQEFEIEGRKHLRRGFLARVRLERYGEGRIFPHEETMSGPRTDRLKLFHTTAMNLCPIFGLYPDEENVVQDELDRAVYRALGLEAVDHLGVVSRLWPVTNQRVVSAVTGMLGPKPIFLADGHHRYETGLRYRDDRLAAGERFDAEAAPNFILMMLVGMSEPGLVILPTHRLVSGIPGITADRLGAMLAPHFTLKTIGRGEAGARETWKRMEAAGGQDVLGLGTVSDDVWQLAHFQSPQHMAELAPEHSDAWRGLAVSVLHVLMLSKLLPGALGAEPQCRYVHLLSEVTAATAAKACQLGVLVPPVAMGHVEQLAGSLERMPPKSTYFYPKLLSGLVLNTLKGN